MTFETIVTGIGVPIVIIIFTWLWWLKGSASKSDARLKNVEKNIDRIDNNVKSVECSSSNLETRIKLFIDDRDKSMLLKFDRTDAKIDRLTDALHEISKSLEVLKTNSENTAKSNNELSKILVKVDKEFEAAKTDIAVLNERVETIRRSA